MCGIIGHVGDGEAIEPLLTGLENLEYRGYDSAGVAVQNGTGIEIAKRSGTVDELVESLEGTHLGGSLGIGHTRWSTHGPPTDENAHPHTDSTADVAVVHNGIIENYGALKERLQEEGHEFTSDTDTEVVPHLIQYYVDRGYDGETAFRNAIEELAGSYAIAAMCDGDDRLYAARDGSPLVVGIDGDDYYLASDVPAFLEYTDDLIYIEDGDVVVLEPDGISITDADGAPVRRRRETVDWDAEETGKGEFDHYMLKEITEQPTSIAQTIEGRYDPRRGSVSFDACEPETFADIDRVVLAACGTSYHAALYGAIVLRRAGVDADAILANEFGVSAPPIDDRTLVVAVTQSGETADTLGALRAASRAGATTLAVTNVIGSSAAREADEQLFIRAGPEIGVAATKTFSSQAIVLTLLADRIATASTGSSSLPIDDICADVDRLPSLVETLLNGSAAESVARRYRGERAFFFIGRGLGYPVALEGALKFKEITYEHAEGFAAGELKHGPLALVTPETPVVAIFTGTEDEKTLKNAEEAATRGAPIVAVCPGGHDAVSLADAHLSIPDVHPMLSGLLATVQLQLVSYHAANLLDREIDKPRNLAKSVTVE
ncbi:glucosamine/fructose-6-phosphate aminotransferase, isomerizing [Halovivax asiaticus JCM 14624]|uniref:Glutamine--fructose-6-phosphate aminotransferase [isomerizing] n=1 Tax=Halovivax asiaticus JCM 14624 TaxID=1227490 RepID=M0BW51_9EURY|nr:glutamine--fructose-6-phosphate transaminase (isomerizing) [Halovivax asiaticus]ELZ14337.1 glucosamine/fructose-6-phosphate aminotransferase, isomerizing [Halovivax asiaticus JCM 14624]